MTRGGDAHAEMDAQRLAVGRPRGSDGRRRRNGRAHADQRQLQLVLGLGKQLDDDRQRELVDHRPRAGNGPVGGRSGELPEHVASATPAGLRRPAGGASRPQLLVRVRSRVTPRGAHRPTTSAPAHSSGCWWSTATGSRSRWSRGPTTASVLDDLARRRATADAAGRAAARPPDVRDPLEDWVRVPVDHGDVEVRARRLARIASARRSPTTASEGQRATSTRPRDVDTPEHRRAGDVDTPRRRLAPSGYRSTGVCGERPRAGRPRPGRDRVLRRGPDRDGALDGVEAHAGEPRRSSP